MTKIILYKDFGAKFTKPVRQCTGSKSTCLVCPACCKRKHFLVRPLRWRVRIRQPQVPWLEEWPRTVRFPNIGCTKQSNTHLSNPIMERVPRTGASVYHQPPPPSDLLPVVASASADPVPEAGLPTVVPAVLRPPVATVHATHMTLFSQDMCNPAQVLSCGWHQWLPRQWCSSKEEVNQYNNRVSDKSAASGSKDRETRAHGRCSWRGAQVTQQEVKIHPKVKILRQIRALRVPAVLDGY